MLGGLLQLDLGLGLDVLTSFKSLANFGSSILICRKELIYWCFGYIFVPSLIHDPFLT